MTDTITHEPIRVSMDGWAGPCIEVPLSQLKQVTALLEAHQVAYWVDEEVLSVDGKPEVAFVNLERRSDPAAVQGLLDRVP
jgi:hypothetical protein